MMMRQCVNDVCRHWLNVNSCKKKIVKTQRAYYTQKEATGQQVDLRLNDDYLVYRRNYDKTKMQHDEYLFNYRLMRVQLVFLKFLANL